MRPSAAGIQRNLSFLDFRCMVSWFPRGEHSGIWGFLISAVLDKKVRACGNCVPYKKHPTIRKNSLRSFLLMRACGNCVPEKNTRPFAKTPFGRFCSCGRAVTALPHALRKQMRARFRKDCFPIVRAYVFFGCFFAVTLPLPSFAPRRPSSPVRSRWRI